MERLVGFSQAGTSERTVIEVKYITTEAAAAERAKVVAWLRKQPHLHPEAQVIESYEMIADAIGACLHHEGDASPINPPEEV